MNEFKKLKQTSKTTVNNWGNVKTVACFIGFGMQFYVSLLVHKTVKSKSYYILPAAENTLDWM